MFEGSNRYFDQALCTGLIITDQDIDALCKAMKEQAVKNSHNKDMPDTDKKCHIMSMMCQILLKDCRIMSR